MQDKHKNIKDAEVVKNDTTNATPEKTAQPTNAAAKNDSAANAAGVTDKAPDTAADNTATKSEPVAAKDTVQKDAGKPNTDTTNAATAAAATGAGEGARNRKPLLAFIAGVLTAIIAWQLYSVITAEQVDNSGEYPDPVATVDGEPVDQDLFEQNMEQTIAGAEAQGVDVTNEEVRSEFENQVLETIINTRLLVAAAAEAGYEPTEEEITERITELEAQFESGEGLDAELESLGLTRADLNTDVTEQLSVDALLRNEVIPEEIAVSDEEVQEVYDGLVEAGQEMPPLEEVRQGIIAQVQQQKQQDLIQTYLDELRAAADVEINL